MSESQVSILDGNTFVVSDKRGDIDASPADTTGLFSYDTRFLSKWVLTVDGNRLNPLSSTTCNTSNPEFFLVPGTGTIYVDATLSIIRQRAVGAGFHEELTILNHDDKAGRPRYPDRRGQRLRRPVRGQGRASQEGQVLPPGQWRPCSGTSENLLRERPRSARRRKPTFDENGSAFTSTSNRTASGAPTWMW